MTAHADRPLVLQLDDKDNVAVVANDAGLPQGSRLLEGKGKGITLLESVPQAHKVALTDIAAGQAVLRYGVPIGYALQNIPAGSWVTEARMRMPASPSLQDLQADEQSAVKPAHMPQQARTENYTFDGYRNADGTVGTRNLLAIGTTVQCVAGVVDYVVQRIRHELLPRFPHVDGVTAIQHAYGCGVAIDAPDADIPIRTLRNILRNPNFGGHPLLVGLGCEKLQPARLFPEYFTASAADVLPTAPMQAVCLQDAHMLGFDSMVEHILTAAHAHLTVLDQRRRESCPASCLRVGLQCGGSDAFSGMTANPALGRAADMIVQAGGTVFFSEVTEVRDGIVQLLARAANAQVARDILREMDWYDRYLTRGGVDRSANTTPGNKQGGLNNITEKTMGSIVKSGSSPIMGVIAPGDRLPETSAGLYFVATPASDFVCGTLQVAAGMNLHAFSTGRGTPYGLREVPVIKVATRQMLARRWHDLIDVDAGRIATGSMDLDEMGQEIFQLMLDVASGRPTAAERLGLYNSLVLFNPAPIT